MAYQYPAVAVVILNWNGKPFLEKFLPAVCATRYPACKIYIADNASTDDSIAFVKENYPELSIISNRGNIGFAAGYNEALALIKADYYVLLNQDVEITPDWIHPVISLMESDHQIAACQPKILAYYQKEYFEYAGAAGGWIDRWGFTFCRGRIFDTLEQDNGQYDKPRQVFWATGASLFIRADVYHEAGGLDPDFFAHMEEIDLCWRLQRMGYRIWCCPQSVVYHVGGGSLAQGSQRKMFLNFRNNLIMLHKNLHGWERLTTLFIRLVMDGMAACRSALTGHLSEVKTILKAHYAYYRWAFSIKKSEHCIKIKYIPRRKINRLSGIYLHSIAWEYFVNKKRYFSSLKIMQDEMRKSV